MSRLIVPSEIIDVFDMMHDKSGSVVWEQAIQIAKAINKVDAVPVVRCKDCKHWGMHKRLNVPWCFEMHIDKSEEGFCDSGERRE